MNAQIRESATPSVKSVNKHLQNKLANRKSKGTVHPRTGHEGPEGEKRYGSTLSLTSALDKGGWSMPHLCHFTPRKDSVPTVQEAGWVLGPDWMVVENLAPTGIQSLDRSARSASLYRLHYPSPLATHTRTKQNILVQSQL